MMYKDKFVVAVKVGGKILRERDGVVYLPFGGEYSLLLKNLESRKSSVKVSIDGQDVLGGKSLLLNPNSSLELERFVESLDRGNKFKFIQKTKEIVEHRGDRVDDGIVRVEFAFEQVTKHVNIVEHHDYYDHHHYYPYWYSYWPIQNYPYHSWDVTCSSGKESSDFVGAVNTSDNLSYQSTPSQDEGITVRGSESHQNFHEGYIGQLEIPSVIIIRLRGESSIGVSIEKPLTVKRKIECVTCGTSLSSIHSHCEKCGTAIEIR